VCARCNSFFLIKKNLLCLHQSVQCTDAEQDTLCGRKNSQFSTNISLYLRNDRHTRKGQSYHKMLTAVCIALSDS